MSNTGWEMVVRVKLRDCLLHGTPQAEQIMRQMIDQEGGLLQVIQGWCDGDDLELVSIKPASAPETEVRPVLAEIDSVAQRIAVIAAGCRDKEVADLTEQEQIALAIIGGCAFERTETGVRVTDAFGIQKVGGKFVVGRRQL